MRLWKGVLVPVAAGAVTWAVLHGRNHQPGWERLEGARFAHRGLHGAGVPENSLSAFRRAAEAGCGAELDVHLTADGHLAVFHDHSLARMCGVEGQVEDLTAAELGGIAHRVGSLTPGKDADIVLCSGHPFELNAKVQAVFINGTPVK